MSTQRITIGGLSVPLAALNVGATAPSARIGKPTQSQESPPRARTESPMQQQPTAPINVDLADALARDDAAEDAGMLGNDRRTCHTCRTWAAPGHPNIPEHKAAIGMPSYMTYDPALGYYQPASDPGLTDDLDRRRGRLDGAAFAAAQNTPVTCPACAGRGCSACDQGRVPAWAADDVVTLTSGDSRPATSMPGGRSGEPGSSGPLNGLGNGEGVTGGGLPVGAPGRGKTDWPIGVNATECGCCRMDHGRAMRSREHCGWCQGGAGHRIAVAIRSRLTRSAPDTEMTAATDGGER